MEGRATLDAIRPLVASQQVHRRTLTVTFCCPQTGQTVQARHTVPQGTALLAGVSGQVRRSLWYEVRRQIGRLLRNVLGRGALASVASHAVYGALRSLEPRPSKSASLSQAEQDGALIEAFRGVQAQFAWVEGRWVHKTAAAERMSPFDVQLTEHPLSTAYDRQVLARMLVEVAVIHGGVGEAERSLLSDLLDAEAGSLESLQRRPPLTGAELSETTAGEARVTLLALVWSLALCDEHLDGSEAAVLERFAMGLQVSRHQAARARELACGYLLDQALERLFVWGEHDAAAREELYALGARIGMARADVERAEARFQKRRG